MIVELFGLDLLHYKEGCGQGQNTESNNSRRLWSVRTPCDTLPATLFVFMIKNSQRQKEKRQEAKWLQSLIGEDWGIRVLPSGADELRPVHANCNERFEAVIAKGRWKKSVPLPGLQEMLGDYWEPEKRPSSRIWLDRLSQKFIIRHFDGVPREFHINGETVVKPETAYFTGRRYRKGETSCLTLLMIDIDAHQVGELKDAMEFADHLKEKYFRNSYVEVSTNGNGAHIFLIIDKTDWQDSDYNAVLKDLGAWLRCVLAETGVVLDDVEIKGTCATVSWKDGMPDHTAGLLAKLPREWERFGELRASPKYTAHQLLALVKANPVKAKEVMPKVQKMRKAGSVPATGVDPVRLNRWLEVGKRLLPSPIHVGKGVYNRLVVTSEDVGITCAMLEFIGKKMNSDGTLPWARTKGLWDCLHQRGVISRSFNAKRFAWVRRFLNGAGLVDMHDPTYVIGERAAKWSPSEKFWSIASSFDTETVSSLYKEGEGGQDFTETCFADDPLECWERGVPLVLAGVTTMQAAERRRMDELIEAIILPSNWKMAA